MKKGIYLLPNMVTMANMFCGFYAIVAATQSLFTYAAIAIVISGVMDFFDGKLARMTHSCSRFGMEFDSLADLISFGMAPAVLCYLWALKPFGRLGWGAAFLYLICGAMRLARFNVQAETAKTSDFIGLPIPAAAILLASEVLLHNRFWDNQIGSSIAVMISAYILAFLMVSNIRYWSLKELHYKKRRPFSLLVASSLYLFVLISEPQLVIFISMLLYTSSGVYNLTKNREAEEKTVAPKRVDAA